MPCASGCCSPARKDPAIALESVQADLEGKNEHSSDPCGILKRENMNAGDNTVMLGHFGGGTENNSLDPGKPFCSTNRRVSVKTKNLPNAQTKEASEEVDACEPTAARSSRSCASQPQRQEREEVRNPQQNADQSTQHEPKTHGKDCCSATPSTPPLERSPSPEGGCCSTNPVKLVAQREHCITLNPSRIATRLEDCVSTAAEQRCQEGCCASDILQPQTTVEQKGREHDPCPSPPPCCEGKSSTCCDTTCIERLALRECINGTPALRTSLDNEEGAKKPPHDVCDKGKHGRVCDGHFQAARQRHQARLDALGCICRALVALGQESCCTPIPGSALKTKDSFRAILSRKSVESCCNGIAIPPGPTITPCMDDCCGGPKTEDIVQEIEEILPRSMGDPDPEKSLAGSEHVILSVSGMTCTGCETKLKRTIGNLSFVTNLKTSLVLARAEFDLDRRVACVEDVIKYLSRATEFKCERVTNRGSTLDFLVTTDPLSFIKAQWPDGVTGIRAIGNKIIRVEYDPKTTDARYLLERGWDNPMVLAPPSSDPTLDASSKHVRHMGLMTVLSAVLTIPVLVMAWAPLPKRDVVYGSVSLALSTIVQTVIAGPFYLKALKDLVYSRTVEVDLLVVLSTSAAYVFSVVSYGHLVSGHPLSTGEFFETSTLLITLIMVGRFVAALARQKAAESISIRALQTPTAILVDRAGVEQKIDARLLQYGDVFKVVPDTHIPTDGTVISGTSDVDESMITGESLPVEKYKGSTVIAGSINGSGTLTVRLTRLPGHNTISTIASMVDEAKLSKPKIQDLADAVAGYFVPVVVTLTIITFGIWIAVGVALRQQSGSEATIQAITYAITVLIVSCPCAIGLAAPMVIVIASGIAAQHGVIFKSAGSIEVAHRTTDVVFDKTGTLTRGELSVCREQYFGDDPATTKSLLLGLVGDSKHPVSAAIVAHLEAGDLSGSYISEPKAFPGKGVEGSHAGETLRAGNSRWLGVSSHTSVQAMLARGLTVFCFTINGTLAAAYGLEDSLRTDAFSTVSKLQEAGVSVHVLSGDDDGAVRSVASQLQIPPKNVRSRCSPADKQAYVKALLGHSKTPLRKSNKAVVIFCGDGTNDTVALAHATIGVHMSSGTDVAKNSADVILLRPGLNGILTMMAVSEKAIRRIKFNFLWSFVYNVFAVLLGAGAFVNARIPPAFAGLGELVSVLPVVAFAVALRWSRI